MARRPRRYDGDQGVKAVTMEIMMMLWRWRSKAQDDDGHIMSHILIACDVYLLCVLFCLFPLLKFQGISVLPEYAPLRKFVVSRHHVMIGVIDSTFKYNGCKTVLPMQNTRVKLYEPSMYRHGLGTLEIERSNVNHIVDMMNIRCSPLMTTPPHVMIGHGLVDMDHVSFR